MPMGSLPPGNPWSLSAIWKRAMRRTYSPWSGKMCSRIILTWRIA
jgi:hypothetical protein